MSEFMDSLCAQVGPLKALTPEAVARITGLGFRLVDSLGAFRQLPAPMSGPRNRQARPSTSASGPAGKASGTGSAMSSTGSANTSSGSSRAIPSTPVRSRRCRWCASSVT